MNSLCVILVFVCAAAGQSLENREPVFSGINPVPAGHPYSIPLGYPYAPAADYQRLSYVPRYEPHPQYYRQFAPHAFPFSFPNTHAVSHAAPQAFSRDIHQASPYLTGPFNAHHLGPYAAHHDRPFGQHFAAAHPAFTAADPAIIRNIISAPKKDGVKEASVAHISGAYPFNFVPSFAYAYTIPIPTKE